MYTIANTGIAKNNIIAMYLIYIFARKGSDYSLNLPHSKTAIGNFG
jgi:hypothetical protein